MKLRSLIVGLVALFALSLAACVGTSVPFKVGAAATGPLITDELSGYVSADTTLSPAAKASMDSDITTLQTATANENSIDYATVSAAWGNVRGVYIAYVQADPTLDADSKALRIATATNFDALLAAEQSRHTALITP